MHKPFILASLLIALLTPFFTSPASGIVPTSTPDLTSTPSVKVVIQVIAATAKFYYGPDKSYPELYTVKKGGKIQIFGTNDDKSWYVFVFNKGRAWIDADPSVVKVVEGDENALPVIETPNFPTPTNTPKPSMTPTPKPANTVLYILNEPVVRVSLLEFHFSTGEQFNKPRSGFKFLIARVKVENLAYTPTWQTSGYEFKLLDAKGALKSTTYVTEAYECRLEIVEIFPKGEAEGCIGFEAPETGALSIVYAPFLYARYGGDRAAVFKIR